MHSLAKSTKVTYMTRFSIHSQLCATLVGLSLISVFMALMAFFLERLLNLPAHLCVRVTAGYFGHSKYLVLDSLGTSPQQTKWLPLACRGCLLIAPLAAL